MAIEKHLGGKSGKDSQNKTAPVKGQKEFVSDVTGEVWKKDSVTRWYNVINKEAIINEDVESKAKGGGTKILPKGSIVFIDDVRGRINPQYRCKDASGNIWFVRTRFIDMKDEAERLTREESDKKAEEVQSNKEQFNYRGGLRVGEQGGDAADGDFTHRKYTGEE